MMTFSNPSFFVGNGKIGEELSTLDWPRRDVHDATENAGDFETEQAKGHVGEAFTFCGKFGHVWMHIGVVDIKRL